MRKILPFCILAAISMPIAAIAQSATPSATWNNSALSSLGIDSATAAAANAQSSGACSEVVQQHLQAGALQAIAGDSALASNDIPYLNSNYGAMSCLGNLLSGANILFEPPNIGGFITSLVGSACSMVQSQEQQAIQPLSQALDPSLPSYEIAPGISTGSIGAGMNLQPTVGNGTLGSAPVQVNVTPLLQSGNGFSYAPQFSNGLFYSLVGK